MLFARFQQKTSNLFAENRLIKMVLVALLYVSWLNHQDLNAALGANRIVLTPLQVKETMWLSGDSASEAYLRDMGIYIASLAGNWHKGNARNNFDLVLNLYAPEKVGTAKVQYMELADRIKRSGRVSNSFFIDRVAVSAERIEVTGKKRRYVKNVTKENSEKTLVISYVIRDYRFMVMDLKERDVNDKRIGAAAKNSET